MSALPSVQFPVDCPACNATAGMPQAAGSTTQSGSLNIQLHCGNCGHHWPFKIPKTIGSRLVVKPDRRRKG